MMNTFSTSAVAKRPNGNELQSALTILTNSGFSIINRDEQSANLTGPGLNNSRQNPLLGASKIRLAFDGYQLRLDAELGGVDSMRKFLMRFPFLLGIGLGLFMGVVGGLIFGRQFGIGFGVPWAQGWTWMLVALGGGILPVIPWLFLSPMVSRLIRSRTEKALATLVNNAVQMSRPA